MKFDIKKPCVDCPFLKGSSTNESLEDGRIEDIVHDVINDYTFQCHKTLDFVNEKAEPQHCGGALVFMEKNFPNRVNNPMRMAERFGIYNKNELDMESDVIDIEDYI